MKLLLVLFVLIAMYPNCHAQNFYNIRCDIIRSRLILRRNIPNSDSIKFNFKDIYGNVIPFVYIARYSRGSAKSEYALSDSGLSIGLDNTIDSIKFSLNQYPEIILMGTVLKTGAEYDVHFGIRGFSGKLNCKRKKTNAQVKLIMEYIKNHGLEKMRRNLCNCSIYTNI